jgi:hypothetical protein
MGAVETLRRSSGCLKPDVEHMTEGAVKGFVGDTEHDLILGRRLPRTRSPAVPALRRQKFCGASRLSPAKQEDKKMRSNRSRCIKQLLPITALFVAMPPAADAEPDVVPIPITMNCFKTPPSVIQGNIEARVTKLLLQDDATGNVWILSTNIDRGYMSVAVYSPNRQILCSVGSTPESAVPPAHRDIVRPPP